MDAAHALITFYCGHRMLDRRQMRQCKENGCNINDNNNNVVVVVFAESNIHACGFVLVGLNNNTNNNNLCLLELQTYRYNHTVNVRHRASLPFSWYSLRLPTKRWPS